MNQTSLSNVIIDPSVQVQVVERGESKEDLHDSTVIWHFSHVGLTALLEASCATHMYPRTDVIVPFRSEQVARWVSSR